VKRRSKKNALGCFSERLEQRRLLSAGLSITYATASTDVSGLSTLSYNGTQLINDSTQNEEFQVPRYYTLSNGVYTAVGGESGFTSTWNVSTNTLTYNYSWGTLVTQYVQEGSNRLNIIFSVNNSADSGVTLGGIDIYPAYIHFPYTITPTDEQQVQYNSSIQSIWSPEVAYRTDGPAVLPADYSDAPTNDGAVMDLVNDGPATQQMYTALWTESGNDGKDYFLIAATAPDANMLNANTADTNNGVDTYTAPLFYTNTAPGQSDSFEVSLRFGPAGTSPTSLATDIETNYSNAYPSVVNWPDRRPIASLHLASYGSNVGSNYNNTIGNPNSWSLDGNQTPSQIDITTTAGLNNFSSGLLSYAATAIQQMTADNSQGMIVWDVEGEEYSQPNPSYIGDPRYAIDPPNGAAPTAPELDYNYQGNGPIIDQFFKEFTSAGFRVGVTLRPTQIVYTSGANPPYAQTPNGGLGSVPEALEVSQLEAKIAYAYTTWGCTLFYVDSTTGFDSSALRVVQQAYPNVLLIPEHNTISTFGTGAAYGELTNDYTGTPTDVYPTYSSAFSVIYIADGNMSAFASELLNSLKNGDIMLFRAWFNDPNNATMLSDYQAVFPVPGETTVTAAAGDGVVNLSWMALGNEAVYNILRSTSLNGTYVPIASGVFTTNYVDTTVSNYQTYYYEVTAVNGAGTGPASASVSATPAGPTVSTAASASPSSVNESSANLSVLGSDQGGGASLKYTWSGISIPANAPPPVFSINGSYQAQNTTAYFYQAGTYYLTVAISDPAGYYTTSNVTVTVNQTVKTMYVLPPKATVVAGNAQQYSVKATDQFSNTIVSPVVTWSVSGGGTISSNGLFTANQSTGTFVITAISGSQAATTTVTIQAAPAMLAFGAVISTSNQLIDIGNGDLIVPNGGPAGLASVEAEIKTGANFSNGYWNGSSGITSSAAANDTTMLTAVGVMLNNNGNTASPAPIYTKFDGVATGLNDVLVMYTYYGDANLDGKIDGSDYSLIDNGYLNHLTGWSNGDFNDDGVINGSDYTLIDNAFNRQNGIIGLGSTPAASVAAQISKPTHTNIFAETKITPVQSQTGTTEQTEELKKHQKQNLQAIFD
jgi:hypothetical protein